MRIARSLALSCMALCSATAWSADLSKIDRTIGKEPAYKGKPKYWKAGWCWGCGLAKLCPLWLESI